jgi:predicted metal-binding membrane protein
VSDTPLEALLRRDRAVVLVALIAVAGLSWATLLYLSAQMGMGIDPSHNGPAGMDMSDMDMATMDMVGAMAADFRSWGATDFTLIFVMWTVMMLAMMTPSVAPMVLLYALVGRRARTDGKPFAPTGWFFAGYVLVWVGFSILATIAQWLLSSAALLTPMMSTAASSIGGLLLILAGLYQWTPFKDVCLRQCQSPIAFLSSHGGFRSDYQGAVKVGLQHGAYCLGCCWALMTLLFVGGVMNIAWVGGIAILVLLEKTLPFGLWIPRITGLLMGIAGIWFFVGH